MARRRRGWDESEHPRWPRGSGDKSGEFRDKNGGDWADRLGDSLGGTSQPAGRYGSVATGQTAQCPRCGRTVKIVGTSGKLSTHNASKGVRCDGSGQTTTAVERGGGVVARRAPRGPKNPEIKAPPPPPIVIGAQHDRVHGAARERMRRWRDGAATPATKMEEYGKTLREWEIENVEREIKDLSRIYEDRKRSVKWTLDRDMNRAGLSWASVQDREDYGYDDEVERQTKHERRSLEQALDYLKALREKTPIPDQQGVRMGIGGYPRQQWTADELDEFVSSGSLSVPALAYDPAHPLDVYGDLLHIDDDTWFTYQALDTLEQAIPPAFHEIVAAHLASYRGRVPSAGIYVTGTRTLLDLDNLGMALTGQPRGWGKGGKWADVSGVVSGGAVAGVANTPNSSPSRYRRTFSTEHPDARAMGNPMAGQQPDPSAMAHEFGHILDWAIGSQRSASSVSTERLWRLVHGKVVREGGSYLSPYFKQKGDAGPEELWADALGIWARGSDDPVLYLEGGAPGLGGTPMQWPTGKPSKVPGRADLRTITWRVQNLSRQYDVPYDVAFEINDYFDRLLKEIKSGKRQTRLQRENSGRRARS